MSALLWALLVPAAAESGPVTVRIGFFGCTGYHQIDENGVKSGYGYDFLTLMKRYADVTYEYVGWDRSWEDMPAMLESGEIDLLTASHRTKEREELFAFSLPIGTSTVKLNVREDDARFTYNDMTAVDGAEIGMVRVSCVIAKLEEYAAEHGFSYTQKLYGSTDELADALRNGEVTAVAANSLRRAEGEKTIAEFGAELFYIMLRKDDTALLDRVNAAIEAMNASEGNWKCDLYYANYEAADRKPVFSEEEQAYIAAHSAGGEKVTVAFDNSWAPFTYKKDGVYTGILPDYWAAIMSMTGMEYEVFDSPNDIIDEADILNGNTDIYLGYSLDPAESEARGFVESSAIMRAGACMLRLKGRTDIAKIAVSDVNPRLNGQLTLSEGQSVKHYATADKAVKALERGEADAVFLYAYEGEMFANSDTTSLIYYQLVPEAGIEVCAITPEKNSRTLIGIVTKCINGMPKTALDAIVTGNVTADAGDVTYMEYFRLHPLVAAGSTACFAALILCVLFAFYRSREEKKHALDLEEKVNEISELNGRLWENQKSLEKAAAAERNQTEQILLLQGILQHSQSRAVADLIDILAHADSAGDTAYRLLSAVGRHFDADVSFVFKRDASGTEMVRHAEWRHEGVSQETGNIPVVRTESILPWVEDYKLRGSFYIPRIDETSSGDKGLRRQLMSKGVCSLMAIPLIKGSRVTGFVGVFNPKVNTGQYVVLSVAASVMNLEIMQDYDRSEPEHPVVSGIV